MSYAHIERSCTRATNNRSTGDVEFNGMSLMNLINTLATLAAIDDESLDSKCHSIPFNWLPEQLYSNLKACLHV